MRRWGTLAATRCTNGSALRGTQVQGDAFLAPIPAQMQKSIAIGLANRMLTRKADGIALTRRLDLDDARTQIRQMSTDRIGSKLGDLNDGHSVQEVETVLGCCQHEPVTNR